MYIILRIYVRKEYCSAMRYATNNKLCTTSKKWVRLIVFSIPLPHMQRFICFFSAFYAEQYSNNTLNESSPIDKIL